MYRKILVGFDDGEQSQDALALGTLLGKATAAQLIVAGIRPYALAAEGIATEEAGDGHRQAEDSFRAHLRVAADDIGAQATIAESTSPARGLNDLAEEIEADVIVLGSSSQADHGRLFAGHTASQLLQGAPCAVAVAPAGYAQGSPHIEKIGVGVDGSEESREAVREAVEVARLTGAGLRLLCATVSPTVGYEGYGGYGGWGYGAFALADAIEGAAESHVDAAQSEVPSDVAAEPAVLHGDAALSLAEESQELDLLCMGSRAYGPLRRVLLGSVSTQLVKNAACPVLVVPRGVSIGPEATEPRSAEGAR